MQRGERQKEKQNFCERCGCRFTSTFIIWSPSPPPGMLGSLNLNYFKICVILLHIFPHTLNDTSSERRNITTFLLKLNLLKVHVFEIMCKLLFWLCSLTLWLLSACAHYILAFTFSSANVTCGHYIYTVSLALQFFSLALAQFSDDPWCWPQRDSFTLQNISNHMQKTTSNCQNIVDLDTFVPCSVLCIFFLFLALSCVVWTFSLASSLGKCALFAKQEIALCLLKWASEEHSV